MTELILTQYSGKILGPIARLLGWIMNGIYMFLSSVFGIENIGLTIIVLTIIIYLLMLPLTIKQQKFSKLSQAMNPEIQAVQKKYKDKKDQASMQAMNEETQAIYQKYGVSPMGSCVQLIIQMPILLAMYRVVYNVPAYVSSVKDTFTELVNGIMATTGFQDTMAQVMTDNKINTVVADFTNKDTTVVSNYIVDVLYKLPTAGWENLKDTFSGLADVITDTQGTLEHLNSFITLNIGNSPKNIIKTSWGAGNYLMLVLAVLIPVISYLSQVLNIKLMPQQASSGENSQADAMAQQMKTMNKIMPLFSLFMCFTVPVGLGLYWIAGSVCRSAQQFVINRHISNLDLDAIIKKNQEKAKKRREKMGIAENQITNAAKMNTKNIQQPAKPVLNKPAMSDQEREAKLEQANLTKKNAKQGSLAAKANMVREFNEKNNK